MRRDIITGIIGIIFISILPMFLLTADCLLPAYYQESYYAELGEMYERLQIVQKPKIVFIGGSNIAFGINTQQLEKTLQQYGYDYTVCSFGLYAAVGSSAMLELSENTIQKGDIIILALEPSSETMSEYFGAKAFLKCSEENKELIRALSWEHKKMLLAEYIPYIQERFALYLENREIEVEGVYAKTAFDDRCDLVYERKGNNMALGYDSSYDIDLKQIEIEKKFQERIKSYCKRLEKKGASVWMTFSPMNEMAVKDASENTLWEFYLYCREAFGCPIISNPADYVMESGWFYDSNYHLNTPGAKLRTWKLAKDILTQLGCTEKISYKISETPDSIAKVEETDDADTEAFLFEPILSGDRTIGYTISGITQNGKNRTTLTIPSVYQGKPVTGFEKDAFRDAKELVNLVIPASIEDLPNKLFVQCEKMERIYLLHTEKLCSVSNESFAAAGEIKICVPQSALRLYQNGDGCESNDWEIYLKQIYTF